MTDELKPATQNGPELLPCPFCGSDDLFCRKAIPSRDVGSVKCRYCFVTTNVKAWNTRTAASDAALSKLQADYDALLVHQASELGSVMAEVRDKALEEAAVTAEHFMDKHRIHTKKKRFDAYAMERFAKNGLWLAAEDIRALKGKTDG